MVDDALKPGTDIGPVVDQSQLAQDLDYIAIGKDEGARLVCGGERVMREHEGFYLTPALFADADGGMRIAQEEIFGPVACAIPADGYEHALSLANASEFGLSSGICTTSLKYATHFRRHVQSGMTMVNLPTAGLTIMCRLAGGRVPVMGRGSRGVMRGSFLRW